MAKNSTFATDAFGHQAVENVTTVYDFHATVLHLLGLDHERLTFYHNGIQRRLTDVHGEIIRGIYRRDAIDCPAGCHVAASGFPLPEADRFSGGMTLATLTHQALRAWSPLSRGAGEEL